MAGAASSAPAEAYGIDADARGDRGFFGHPRGLKTLFFTELWERFSYYGMRSILILFMTAAAADGGLGFAVSKAGAIYGIYTALVYLLCLPGGWLADRILGQRRATLVGGIAIMIGHVNLALPGLATFYLGLGCVVIGTGLLKPNISTMIGQLYAPGDGRRDAGFSIYYMGINLGAFLAPLACGWIAQGAWPRAWLAAHGHGPEAAWHLGFGMAALGMACGLVQYVRGGTALGAAGLAPVRIAGDAGPRYGALAAAFAAAAVAAAAVSRMTAAQLSAALGTLLLLITVVFFAALFVVGRWTPAERARLLAVLALFFGAAVFWSLFEQGGSTLTLFAERNTAREVSGFTIPASWFASLNAILIIVFAPLFAWGWARLGTREPAAPAKFTLGLTFVALGFGVLVVAALAAEGGAKVSPWWLVATYVLHTIGELCLSPVGLSAMTKLAPARIAGLTMGVWFLATSVGNYLGARVAGLYEAFTLPQLFGAVTAFAGGAALLMALLVGPLRRMLAGSTAARQDGDPI